MTRAYAIFTGLVAACLCALGLFVLRAHRSPAGPDPRSLLAKAEALVARWTTEKLPLDGRMLTLLVYDRSSDGDLLDPQAWSAASGGSWFDRLLGTRKRPAPETAAFLEAMRQDTSVLSLPLDGFSARNQSVYVNMLTAMLAQAHDAGGEVDIVTQGAGVVPALKALAALEGVKRQDAPVGVNKLVSLGVDRKRLKRIDPVLFAEPPRPANVLEWATFYRDPAAGPVFELSTRGGPASELSPEGVFVVSGAELAHAVLAMVKEARTIQTIAQAAQSSAERERRERTFRAVKDGNVTTRSPEPAPPPSAPQPEESLSMVVGGKEYSETGAETAPSPTRAVEARTEVKAPAVDWARLDPACAECCAGAGGRWSRGDHDAEMCWNQACRKKYGCCEGAEYDYRSPSQACRRCGASSKGIDLHFGDGGGYSSFRCK